MNVDIKEGAIMCELHHAMERAGADIVGCHVFWNGGDKHLALFTVTFGGKEGAVLHFENPPVHQIDTQALYWYGQALEEIEERKDELSFLIFSFAPDPVHAGGDLKETLANLQNRKGYFWADRRLLKAFTLYKRVRALAKRMRVISILAGGEHYGGSAEVPLWADYTVGDSRSSICLSEAGIGLIPGWSGIARLITKAGYENARRLVETMRKTNARELKAIGVVNTVAEIPLPFPQKGTPSDEVQYLVRETLSALFDKAFLLASSDESRQGVSEADRVTLECGEASKPRAPQSMKALDELFGAFHPQCFDEERFARMEMKCDAALYRDPRLTEGITAVLEKRIPKFLREEEARG